jgi:hypothetical protein
MGGWRTPRQIEPDYLRVDQSDTARQLKLWQKRKGFFLRFRKVKLVLLAAAGTNAFEQNTEKPSRRSRIQLS